jgi:hypothetical protein
VSFDPHDYRDPPLPRHWRGAGTYEARISARPRARYGGAGARWRRCSSPPLNISSDGVPSMLDTCSQGKVRPPATLLALVKRRQTFERDEKG